MELEGSLQCIQNTAIRSYASPDEFNSDFHNISSTMISLNCTLPSGYYCDLEKGLCAFISGELC
jgi:hypothetical protein